ncbi:MAG: hypothetical protein HRU20_25735 [Pseudomonadales bacterium]|nr:hypothetical protein [Pseudomonadales bacterium]
MLEGIVGNWIGTGTFEIGGITKPVIETLAVFNADVEGVYSYVRKSNISEGGETTTHDEEGYVGLELSQVALSRGTVVRLENVHATQTAISYDAMMFRA